LEDADERWVPASLATTGPHAAATAPTAAIANEIDRALIALRMPTPPFILSLEEADALVDAP
jgi:hypothetical protein